MTKVRTIAALLLLLAQGALAQPAPAPFDHITTGYELTGAHRVQACETCHVDGVFQGTPRECAACHSVGSRIGATPKTQDHIRSTERCAACHTTSAWTPATRFTHDETIGSCTSCHNGALVAGKPAGHVATTLECGACHGTSAWLPTHFDHSSVTEPCANCHNGGRATGKGATHIQSSNACDACHTTSAW
ncbi:MAG TPA: hypothetical protein PK163_03495, partial [Steroidobacteraceae bacterium]|nr:hypothetical protein [Steroidobacteraceae bacterium]